MPDRVDDETLRLYCAREIEAATGYIGDNLSSERQKAYDYYYAEPFGDEIDGRSGVVTTDVQDTVESIMPDLMEIFAGGDQVVKFNPRGPEDIEAAEQATDYVGYVWSNDNDGYAITHDLIKDALLQKVGVGKVTWNDAPIETRDTLTGLNFLQLQELVDDPEVEILEQEERAPEDEEAQYAPDGKMYDVTILRTRENGRVAITAIPPDEFLISARAASLDDASFLCHRSLKTVSDLVAMGVDYDVASALPSDEDNWRSDERNQRYEDESGWPEMSRALNEAMREVWVFECYIMADRDGDGVAEWNYALLGGAGNELLLGPDVVDSHPFFSMTPIKMPHRWYGRSIADLTMDVQRVKSTILRQWLDNLYFINNGRTVVNGNINLDDILTNRPNQIVRSRGIAPVSANVMPLVTQPIGPVIQQALEYWDGVRETRTGETRYSQGTDADSLNKTAFGIGQILSRAAKRKMLIARNMAELGFKPAFKKILKLVINHQDRPRTIRLRNKWVEMDPRSWNSEMDVSVTVGLGHGTKEQEMGGIQMVLTLMEKMIMLQQGVNGPFVMPEHLHHAMKKAVQIAGFRDADSYLADPSGKQIQPPPNPEAQKGQAEMQMKQAEMQMRQQEAQAQLQLKQAEAQADIQIEREKMGLERERMMAEIALEREKMAADIQLAQHKARVDMALKEQQAAMTMQLSARKAATDAEIKREATKNQPKGN